MSKEFNGIRSQRGKLICAWSPILHGEGCSTASCSIGFGLQYVSGKRVLIVNKSNSRSHMEKYLERDIEIRYSLDNLKIFNTGLKAEHIVTYATQVNPHLFILSGSRLKREITKENVEFERLFIERALELFDIVIVDLETGVREENELYLKLADKIMAVITPNEVILDELYKQPEYKYEREYFTKDKSFYILNKLYEGWMGNTVISGYKNRYKMTDVFGFSYDGDVLKACCSERRLYSFLMKELIHCKNSYAVQLKDICDYLVDELSLEAYSTENNKNRNVLRKLLRSSLF